MACTTLGLHGPRCRCMRKAQNGRADWPSWYAPSHTLLMAGQRWPASSALFKQPLVVVSIPRGCPRHETEEPIGRVGHLSVIGHRPMARQHRVCLVGGAFIKPCGNGLAPGKGKGGRWSDQGSQLHAPTWPVHGWPAWSCHVPRHQHQQSNWTSRQKFPVTTLGP